MTTARVGRLNSKHLDCKRWLAALITAMCMAVALGSSEIAAIGGSATGQPEPPGIPLVGRTADCDNFRLAVLPLDLLSFDLPDEGWTWVEPAGRRFRSVSGLVVASDVASNDTGANHDSHDVDVAVLVDPGQEGILSSVNRDHADDPRLPPEFERGVDRIGMEWETGIRPTEKSGDGAPPMFPKWAWPSIGDRVWTEGHWVFDCGHPDEVVIGTVETPVGPVPIKEKRYRSEIHPARAVASMRDQARPLPQSGNVPVPVTATDVYIHGRAGFVVDQLNCGMGIIVNGVGGSGNPDTCHTKTSPIDVDFNFDVCLPPRPAGSTLAWAVEPGPGNTLSTAPEIHSTAATGACLLGDQFDHGEMLHVRVPLAGTGAAPEDIYARKIDAGWVGGAQPPLRRFRVTLNQMDLHDDHDDVPFNQGELSFFWMNINRAADGEWIRLADFANGNMNNYDDSPGNGDGEMNFTGAVFDFYVRPGQPFTIRTHGYDQDCLDDTFGDHTLSLLSYVNCYTLNISEAGANDRLISLPSPVAPDATTFGPNSSPEYGVGNRDLAALYQVANPFPPPAILLRSEYELEITIEEILDDVPPTSIATPAPPANAAGWNNTAVTVNVSATDNPGGTGVASIVISATGAETINTEVAGSTASVVVSAEGATTVTYFAKDAQGNVEAAKMLELRIDRTPPTITGTRAPAANQHGWNNTDVVVAFSCADALSGVASCGPTPQIVSTEGLGQSRSATAVDVAGNTATVTVSGINIDKTPPVLSGLPANCVLWPANHQLVPAGTAAAFDALSGVLPGSFVVTGSSSEPDNGKGDGNSTPDIVIQNTTVSGHQLVTIQLRAERAGPKNGRVYTLSSTAQDLAGNVGTGAGLCTVPHNP